MSTNYCRNFGSRSSANFTGGWVGPKAGLDGRKISPHSDSFFSYETVNACITASAYSLSNLYNFRIHFVLRYLVNDLVCYSLGVACMS